MGESLIFNLGKLQTWLSTMKTPERWRPSRDVPSLSVFFPKVVNRRHVMWRQRDVKWRHMPWQKWIYGFIYTGHTTKKSEKHVFQNGDLHLWPVTLTFKLIQDITKDNVQTETVQTPNGSAGRALTDRRTDRQDRFYTLIHWRGREKYQSVKYL